MEITQCVGGIASTPQISKRSKESNHNPSIDIPTNGNGEEVVNQEQEQEEEEEEFGMDMTECVGGIRGSSSTPAAGNGILVTPSKYFDLSSMPATPASVTGSEAENFTMDITECIGGIHGNASKNATPMSMKSNRSIYGMIKITASFLYI